MYDYIEGIRTEIEREKFARDILGIADTADENEIKRKYSQNYKTITNE